MNHLKVGAQKKTNKVKTDKIDNNGIPTREGSSCVTAEIFDWSREGHFHYRRL